MDVIVEGGRSCSQCKKLMNQIQTGFPDHKQQLDEDLREFWSVRDELSVVNGIILMGKRLFVPRAARSTIMSALHSAHQGQERTLKRARQCVFWPGMTNDLKNTVQGCEQCIRFLPSQTKEPLRAEIAEYPFDIMHLDLFQYAGYEYLIAVDKLSGWPMLARTGKSTDTEKVLKYLRAWFAEAGIPYCSKWVPATCRVCVLPAVHFFQS